MKRATNRKGFTLVELLIVIVVIGILSAMMMLSSTEAVSSARASNIVSNLRNLKTAALAFYVDHMDMMENAKDIKASAQACNNTNFKIGSSNVTFIKAVGAYMSNADSATDLSTKGYGVMIDSNGDWFVTYNFSEGSEAEKTSVKNKLAGRAQTVGLVDGGMTGSGSNATFAPKKTTPYTSDKAGVAMYVR